MKSKNMNYMFNVEYFNGLNLMVDEPKDNASDGEINKKDQKTESDIVKEEFNRRNTELTGFRFSESYGGFNSLEGFSCFELKTLYPGLLIGIGNPHNISAAGAIKIGFTFDAVTGVPYIEGSSLKGVLRSAFPDYKYLSNSKDVDELERGKLIAAVELLEESGLISKGMPTKIDTDEADVRNFVKKYVEVLFEKTKIIYLGVFPILGENGKKLLGTDFITPHEDPLKNPVPIGIIKVKPDVVFRFEFVIPNVLWDKKVKDTKGGKTGKEGMAGKEDSYKYDNLNLDREKILKLFKQIILIWGIGAKTNVGYGNFTENTTVSDEYAEDSNNKNHDMQKQGTDKEFKDDKTSSKGNRYSKESQENTGTLFGEKIKSLFNNQRQLIDAKCKNCKKAVSIDKRTGNPYEYCQKCYNLIKKRK